MALASAIQWEVRQAGSGTNGGGFKAGATGTDWTQQTSPQYSVTDAVTNGTTTITSATATFGTDVVGNVLYIQGGTGGIVAGWYEITARNSATSITVDRSTGLTAGTGATLKIGGALNSLTTVAPLVVAGNTVHVKGDAIYTTAATITLSIDASDGLPIAYIGYATTRGDNGQATIQATNAAATQVLSVSGLGSILRNLTADGNNLSLRGIYVQDISVTLDGCEGKNATQHGIFVTAGGTEAVVKRCRATGNGSSGSHGGFACSSDTATFDRCVARGNAGNGFVVLNDVGKFLNCLAHGNTLSGFYIDGALTSAVMVDCTSYGNTLDGIRLAAAASLTGGLFRNNLLISNSGYGIRSLVTDYGAAAALAAQFENNGYYGNTLGARSQVPAGIGDVTLTADPFSSAAANDFSLNFAIGGGLSARGAGVPGSYGLRSSAETSTGLSDLGAVPSGGGAASGTLLAAARSLWRELTNERSATVVPDSVVDVYLQRGVEALNDAIRYHRTTDTTTVLLTAGTQENSLPADYIEMEWVSWNGKDLEKGDVERWRQNGIDWRNEPSGAPMEWAVYANKLILRPTPGAYAVSQSAALTLRYVSTPASVTNFGFAQLPNHYHRLAVYYAAALWAAAYPESQRSVLLEKGLMERFAAETQAAAADYGARVLR